MEKLPMCRICLAQNVRMILVVDKNLHDMYEKLTDVAFVTEDSRPILACFFCCTKLKQCYRLLRQCLVAEELFAQKMIEDYQPNPLLLQDHLKFYSGFVKSPTEYISIASKEVLPADCEGLDIIEPKEEHLTGELELENFDNSCLDVADIAPHDSESDLEDDVPLMEFKTEVEEEQEVSKKKRRTRVTITTVHSDAESGGIIGSDMDAEDQLADYVDYPAVVRRPSLATDNPAVLPDNFDPRLRNAIDQMDRQNDRAIRSTLPIDRVVFDWQPDLNGFTGVREEFTGTPGPTFPMSEMESPVHVFLKFWDLEIMSLIEKETNNYAAHCLDKPGVNSSSHMRRWRPTRVHELYIFFALIIQQSLFPATVETEYFYPSHMAAKPFKEYMTYNRMILLKKFLHFANNGNMSDSLSLEERRIYKIKPVINHLNRKFQDLYLPRQNVAIDESLLKLHGHLTFIQKIATKPAKTRIKSYELCESDTGYLWKFTIYAAKKAATDRQGQDLTKRAVETHQMNESEQADETDQRDETNRPDKTDLHPAGATAKMVYDLVNPLFQKGYTLILDHFNNSPLLARSLKLRGTDCYGTLRLNRESVPDSMKSLTEQQLRTGDVVSSTSGDLNVIVWKDANVVCMLSTYHKVEVGASEKFGRWGFKPQVELDYNKAMTGVDKKDQMLSNFPLERSRNSIWYKKLFRRLLNISVQNAFVIYKCKDIRITHRNFRLQVAEGLLKMFYQHCVAPQIRTSVQTIRQLPSTKRGQKPKPVLENNHFSVKITEKPLKKTCVWCSENNKRCRVTWKCDVCEVALCVECMKPYHTGVRAD